MPLRLATLLPVAALITAAPVPAAAQTNDLFSVQHHLQALTTMTADFTQTDRDGKVLTGTLTWKQPGKIRFQYQKGVPILIVAEGGALTFIDYSVRQVQRWPIRNSPLGVLLDPGRDLSRFAKVAPGSDPRVLSIDANDPKHPEYGRINLVFAHDASGPAGLVLQGWVALDSQNNRTTIRLTHQRYGGPIGDSAFAWNDPRHNAANGGRH
jgi:outer membrane lipoprotein-sorting protein